MLVLGLAFLVRVAVLENRDEVGRARRTLVGRRLGMRMLEGNVESHATRPRDRRHPGRGDES